MPAKSRFTRLDAFTKTVEDARVRTTSGGVVTIGSLLVVLYLIWVEWLDFRRVVVHPELIVDKSRGGFHVQARIVLLYGRKLILWSLLLTAYMLVHSPCQHLRQRRMIIGALFHGSW